MRPAESKIQQRNILEGQKAPERGLEGRGPFPIRRVSAESVQESQEQRDRGREKDQSGQVVSGPKLHLPVRAPEARAPDPPNGAANRQPGVLQIRPEIGLPAFVVPFHHLPGEDPAHLNRFLEKHLEMAAGDCSKGGEVQ